MKIEQHVPLGPKTTFRIGGNARYFVEVSTVAELKEAVAYAAIQKVPIFVLGGGSNLLISDQGFSGLVIKNALKGISFDEYPKTVDCKVFAGESWDDVVAQAVSKGLGGIENLSLIPGTLGGAIVQNIGAYGSEIKDVVSTVDVFNISTGFVEKRSLEDCHFAYRNSFFKTLEGRGYIVVSATLRLTKGENGEGPKPKIDYKDLIEYFKNIAPVEAPTIASVREAVVSIRLSKLPDVRGDASVHTAGSFFKNPIISEIEFQKLKTRYPDLPGFKTEAGYKIPLGWIIDHICNLKGYRQGDAGIYEKQALVLVNYGKATQKNIDELAGFIARTVFEKTGIAIEREVESVLG